MLRKVFNFFKKEPSPEKEPDVYIQNSIKLMNEEVPSMVKDLSLLKEKLMGLEKNVKQLTSDMQRFTDQLQNPGISESERVHIIQDEYSKCKDRFQSLAAELKHNQEAYVHAFNSLRLYIKDKKEKMHHALKFIEDKHQAAWRSRLDHIIGKFDHFKNGTVSVKVSEIKEMPSAHDEYVAELLAEAELKIFEIKKVSERINESPVRHTIDDIINLVQSILSSVKSDPDHASRAKNFFMYYLESTSRIINSYISISQKNIHTNKIDQSLAKAENMLLKIKEVCEKQLHEFCEDEIIDLDAEMEVLERTIKLEG